MDITTQGLRTAFNLYHSKNADASTCSASRYHKNAKFALRKYLDAGGKLRIKQLQNKRKRETGRCERRRRERDAGNEGVCDAGKEKRRKERNKGRKERRKGKERKKKGRGRMAGYGLSTVAGGGRIWPEKVAKAPSPRNLEGASVVQKGKMEF